VRGYRVQYGVVDFRTNFIVAKLGISFRFSLRSGHFGKAE